MSGEAAMLVRITDAAEAEVALKGGADVLGLTDARGCLSRDTLRMIVATTSGRRPISAAPNVLLPEDAESDAAATLAEAGVGIIEWDADDEALAASAQIRARFPAVASAVRCATDNRAALARLGLFAEQGFSTAILVRSGTARLIDSPGIEALAAFVNAAQRRGLRAWLGGALEPPDVPRLLALQPDGLVFRASLCHGGQREAPLDATSVSHMRDLLPRAASLTSALVGGVGTGKDKVFVRDFVIRAGIGAYQHEHREPQRMRFNVEADLAPIPSTVTDMRDVFSYDVIVDAIRLATRHHTLLVERIALDVADSTLRDSRVRRVRVRVEKLDILDGSVGVEIERSAAGA